ncbi:isopentenyl-diphosphate Delta-isomerase [Agromyces sp. NPDC057679]|uniref:isopentenyl-diphosphate Delta-isomerase n=1 Tax=Agromyces sp. NPDC057679 TaxID=3346207 RepID=UPI003671A1EF
MGPDDIEEVVLLDAHDRPVGRAPKSSVHGLDTARHLAFSCHVFNGRGEVLVTRRALSKQAWPGVWTNSFCGHPAPAETLLHAVRRRGEFELGLELDRIDLVLPTFHYRATDASGIVENELCPVYTATTDSTPEPHPGEVMDHRWVELEQLALAIEHAPWAFSPWFVLQSRLLPFLGGSRADRSAREAIAS